MRRFLALSVVVALAAVAAACGNKEQSIQKPPRPVKAQVVESYAVQPRLRYSANIEPREQVTLAFKVNGYVREVRQTRGADGKMRNLQEGDVVPRGTVLARVRDEDYQESVNRAKASLAQAEVSFQKTTLDYERAKRLFEKDSLTKPDFDSAKAAYDAARTQVDSAKASLAEAEIRLRDTALVAPIDGVLMKREIEVGSLVRPGSTGFVIADTTSVKAIFGVPDILIRRARLGIVLPITTETYGTREFPGRITAISPAADPSSRVFDVELTIANPQNLLKSGMIATVAVPEENPGAAQAQAEALVVPLAAIVKPQQSAQFAVYVVVDQAGGQVVRLRPVDVGEVFGNRVAVRKGVQRGDRVVVTGASLLADNEAVVMIP
jgi:multidrug efflux system membrane fusion protein